jgi:hypothetical protein
VVFHRHSTTLSGKRAEIRNNHENLYVLFEAKYRLLAYLIQKLDIRGEGRKIRQL